MTIEDLLEKYPKLRESLTPATEWTLPLYFSSRPDTPQFGEPPLETITIGLTTDEPRPIALLYITEDSMSDAGIKEGDHMVIRQIDEPRDGALMAMVFGGSNVIHRHRAGESTELMYGMVSELIRAMR